MRIGVSSWTYPYAIGNKAHEQPQKPLGLMGLLELAIRHGAEVLQIADNLPLIQADTALLSRLSDRAAQAGIALEIGTAGLHGDNLMAHLDIAGRLGAKLVRTLPHRGADVPDFDTARQHVAAVLPRFEAEGVRLGIENHDHYRSLWIRELVDAFDSPFLGVCLDAVNNLGQGEGFHEVLHALAPVTINFHCKDYTIRRKPSMLGFDVEGAIAGEGFLDLNQVAAALPRDISWIIESWLPWQGTLEDTLALEAEWAIRGIANLKAFRAGMLEA